MLLFICFIYCFWASSQLTKGCFHLAFAVAIERSVLQSHQRLSSVLNLSSIICIHMQFLRESILFSKLSPKVCRVSANKFFSPHIFRHLDPRVSRCRSIATCSSINASSRLFQKPKCEHQC